MTEIVLGSLVETLTEDEFNGQEGMVVAEDIHPYYGPMYQVRFLDLFPVDPLWFRSEELRFLE